MSRRARRMWAAGAVCAAVLGAAAATVAVWRVGLAPAGAQEMVAPGERTFVRGNRACYDGLMKVQRVS